MRKSTDGVNPHPSKGPAGELSHLKALIDRDELTSLYNRRYFKRRFEKERARADEQGSPLSILMIDVDNFKTINDSLGHSAGDTVLKSVAQLLSESIRKTDACCRYAGDEFVVILPGAEEENARRIAETIRKNLSEYRWEEKTSLPIESLSVSIGYAVYPKHEVNLSMLFDRADMALLGAKRAGRNRVSGPREYPDVAREPSLVSAPFMHRDRETTVLESALQSAEKGEGRVLLIIGEAGVGKTSLLSNFRRQTMICRLLTLSGSSYPETQGLPYYAFREMLNQVASSPPFLEKYSSLKHIYRKEIQKIAPQLSQDVEERRTGAAYEPDMYLLYEGIFHLLSLIASRNPLMLIFEDIHWADGATLSLLRYIGRKISSRKMMICATARLEELARKDESTGDVRSFVNEPFCQTIELVPFTREQSQKLVQSMFPAASSMFASHIHSLARGNPLFIVETIRSIPGDRMGLVLEAREMEELKGAVDMPESIHKLLARRLDALDEETRRVLSCAAVLGSEFDFKILSRLVDMNEGNLLDVLDDAVQSQLISESAGVTVDSYGFQHVLVADFLYHGLNPGRRAFLHEKAARILETEPGRTPAENPGVLAHHFARARKPEKEYVYCKRAGKKAMDAYANREARAYLERAARILQGTNREDRADETMEIDHLLGSLDERIGDYESARKRFESVLETARRNGNARKESDALTSLGVMHERLGSFEESLGFYRTSLAIKERLQDREGMGKAMHNIANVYTHKGNYKESMRWYEKAMAAFEETGNDYGSAFSLCNMGVVLQLQGDYETALEYYQESLKLRDRINDLRGKVYSLDNMGGIYYIKGDYGTSFRYRENALKIAQEIEHKKGMAFNLQNMASVKKEMGAFEQARELAERSLRIADEMSYKPLYPRSKTIMGEILCEMGETEAASRYCFEAEKESEEMGSKRDEADAHRVMGLIHITRNEFKKAEDQLKKALRCYQTIGMKEGREEVYYALGKMELAKGRNPRARNHFLRARELYHEAGNRTWSQRIDREMKDWGLVQEE
ncbi:MAG: diguanylate cyclase [bacterium]